MGNLAQKRLIRKLELELFLSKMETQPSPKSNLEQYTISDAIAATMLYLASYTNDDVIGKKVIDLGCGSGKLALAASYLGAQRVVGVDIDKTAMGLVRRRTSTKHRSITLVVRSFILRWLGKLKTAKSSGRSFSNCRTILG